MTVVEIIIAALHCLSNSGHRVDCSASYVCDGSWCTKSDRCGSLTKNIDKNSSGDEIANVNFLRRYGTYVLQNTKKREPTLFNQLDDS